jgi:hypothetical protein
MLPKRTAVSVCAICLCALALPTAAEATLVTRFHFNGYAGGLGVIPANSSTGGITLSNIAATGVTAVDGTELNRVGTDAAGKAVSLNNNGGNPTNVEIEFNSQGYSNLALSFAAQGSNSTYNIATVQYFDFVSNSYMTAAPPNSFDPATGGNWNVISFDLSHVTGLNNHETARLRLILSGNNENPGQRLFIDNLQINGASTPEPAGLAMMGLAGLAFAGAGYRTRRGRNRSRQTAIDLGLAG